MTEQEIKDRAPDGATHYRLRWCKLGNKWLSDKIRYYFYDESISCYPTLIRVDGSRIISYDSDCIIELKPL